MIKRLLDMFVPGAAIYLPGATGEIVALTEALANDPGRMAGVHIVSCLLPGINRFDYAGLAPDAKLTCFLMSPQLQASFAAGRISLVPLAYSAIARHLETRSIDIAIAHVARPVGGRASFGIAADFSPIAWARARCRIAIINPQMPTLPRAPTIDLVDADLVVEMDSALLELSTPAADQTAICIAERAATLIPDGAAIQIGIGAAPAAIWAALEGHRKLTLRSGMVADSILRLASAGALSDDDHIAGIAVGPASFYSTLADCGLVRLTDTRETHDVAKNGACRAFTAINSALAVDLFGQTNLEWHQGKMISGVGGAPDFVAAAFASPKGRALTLLPATARSGTISRIVPRLDTPSISLPRTMADTVVTEHGIAFLRDAAMDDRAAALIAIAAPAWREPLEREWRILRATLH